MTVLTRPCGRSSEILRGLYPGVGTATDPGGDRRLAAHGREGPGRGRPVWAGETRTLAIRRDGGEEGWNRGTEAGVARWWRG